MQAHMPSEDLVYHAESADAWIAHLSSSRTSPRLSLVDLVQSLMAVDPVSPQLADLTTYTLFLTIGGASLDPSIALKLTRLVALQTMIFTSKAQLIDTPQVVRFERALARWKEIWNRSRQTQPTSKHDGFMRHAQEVWLLASKVLNSDVSQLISRFEVNDMSQARRWLAELG